MVGPEKNTAFFALNFSEKGRRTGNCGVLALTGYSHFYIVLPFFSHNIPVMTVLI
jgi:hypothetical protein